MRTFSSSVPELCCCLLLMLVGCNRFYSFFPSSYCGLSSNHSLNGSRLASLFLARKPAVFFPSY